MYYVSHFLYWQFFLMSISLLKLKLGAQSDNTSCKDSLILYRAKDIYCKTGGVLNAKVLCEDKRITDILIFLAFLQKL